MVRKDVSRAELATLRRLERIMREKAMREKQAEEEWEKSDAKEAEGGI